MADSNRVENPPAFPVEDLRDEYGNGLVQGSPGMSLHDWFAGQALGNQAICTGSCATWELTKWFGPDRTGITRAEIIAKQAGEYADAMLIARQTPDTSR